MELKAVLKCSLFLLCILFSGSAYSNSTYIKGCSEFQVRRLTEFSQLARPVVDEMIEELIQLRGTSILPEDFALIAGPYSRFSRLTRAIKILRCAKAKLQTTIYSCENNPKNYTARTFYIFSDKVSVSSNLFVGDLKYGVGVLVHEAAHMCGATDAAYFNSPGDGKYAPIPHDVGPIPWDLIADTYSYWIEHKVCIPNETCKLH